jgi:magnesium transporter
MYVLDDADLAQLRSLQGGEEPVWLNLCDPDDEELDSVGELLGLHPLAIEDSREFGSARCTGRSRSSGRSSIAR